MAGVPARNERRISSPISKLRACAAALILVAAASGITWQRASARASAPSKSSIACSTESSANTCDRASVAARLSTSRVNMISILHVEEHGFAIALQDDIEAPGRRIAPAPARHEGRAALFGHQGKHRVGLVGRIAIEIDARVQMAQESA